METATKLVDQTFVEKLSIEQSIKKKEFMEIKIKLEKVNTDKLNQEKLHQIEYKRKCMAFDYLWRCFPEIMATKNQNPAIFFKEVEDSEFEKILKAARHHNGVRVAFAIVSVLGAWVGAILGAMFVHPVFVGLMFGLFPLSIIALGIPLESYFDPIARHNSYLGRGKQKKFLEFYQNAQKMKQDE